MTLPHNRLLQAPWKESPQNGLPSQNALPRPGVPLRAGLAVKGEVNHNPDQKPRIGSQPSRVSLREAGRHSRAAHALRGRIKASVPNSRGDARSRRDRVRAAGLSSSPAEGPSSNKVLEKAAGLRSNRGDARSRKDKVREADRHSSPAAEGLSSNPVGVRSRRAWDRASVPNNRGGARTRNRVRVKAPGLRSSRAVRNRKGRVKAAGRRMAARRTTVPNQGPRRREPVSPDHRKANRPLHRGRKSLLPTTKVLRAGASLRRLLNPARHRPKRPPTTASGRVNPRGITAGRRRNPSTNAKKRRTSCRRRKSSPLRLPSRSENWPISSGAARLI